MPVVWYKNTDMYVRLTGLRASTMSAGSFLTNSTGVSITVYDARSTSGTKLVNGRNVPYVSSVSSGRYQVTIQSSEFHSMSTGQVGMAVVDVSHLTLQAQWRTPFRVDFKRG